MTADLSPYFELIREISTENSHPEARQRVITATRRLIIAAREVKLSLDNFDRLLKSN